MDIMSLEDVGDISPLLELAEKVGDSNLEWEQVVDGLFQHKGEKNCMISQLVREYSKLIVRMPPSIRRYS